ncbi:hypothetical protein PBY51_022304 [Eleginops maclovinus]|uniref:Uncharacterized protein n=1 Tax=Eleginops maclovinus TaxID=56733 RepID=A0AAN7XCS1_ELEMC|nr:hypothetical protein PBY51_022304 [Eleginops maclovinus]
MSFIHRKNRSYPRSTSETNLEDESGDESKDEDETIIHSDAESESLLHPVFLPLLATLAEASTQTTPELPPIEVHCKTEAQSLSLSLFTHDGNYPEQSPVHSEPDHHTTGPSVPQRKPVSPLPSAHTHAGDSACVNPPTSCSLPVAQSPEPSVDSSSFWRSCNAAGCTEAIFRGFNNEMSDISGRIQSEQASQEDFNLALTVMRASGKLSELVAKQQEELQVRQRELQKAAAAMEEAVSVLRR